MGTSIPVDDDTKDRLEDYRTTGYDSWDDTLNGLMTMLPDADTLAEGCQADGCDNDLLVMEDDTYENTSGVIHTFYTTDHGDEMHNARYFCSAECAHEQRQQENAFIPDEPDTVLVGGFTEPQVELADTTFFMDDRGHREVGLDVPGAFGGADSHGDEYDYLGEPVYIYNRDRWVQDGIIEDIYHEERHTGLQLGRGRYPLRALNHPNDERRAEYRDEWGDEKEFAECEACGTVFEYEPESEPETCPVCERDEW